MSLRRLRARWRRRARLRRKRKRLYRESGKRGYALAAARDGKAMRKLRSLIHRVLQRRKGTIAGINFKGFSGGRPRWGGSADVMGQFVAPFLQKRGLPKGSGKRTPWYNRIIGGSPSSDHLTTKLFTFARDFPTFTGEDDARALAAAAGISGWSPNSYTTHRINIKGHLFDIQILWGAGIAHGDHIHVGISYVGKA